MRMTPRGPGVTQSHEDDTKGTRCNTVTGGCHPGGPMSQSHSHRRMTPRRTKCHSYTQSQEVVTQADQVSQLHTVTGRRHPGGPSVTVTQSQEDDSHRRMTPRGTRCHKVTGG